MPHHIEYHLAPQSPWTYLGHERFVRMAKDAGATVQVMPTDLGKVFPISGGLPLGKRAPQRQAYRLVELKRFSDFLGIPMNVQPKFFPVSGDDASRLIIATDMALGSDAALKLTGAILTACWAQERNIADPATLAALLEECQLSADAVAQVPGASVQARYDANTQVSIDRGVFGAPSYVIDGEIFWGQDRLDFVQRKLQSA